MISRGFASTQGGVILWEDGFTLINGLKKILRKSRCWLMRSNT